MNDRPLDMAALVRVIRRRREGLGWNLHRLAVRAGVADPAMRRLEAGKTEDIGLNTLMRIAAALGTTVIDLLEEAGAEQESRIPGELSEIYPELGTTERRALLQNALTLRELQESYRALQESTDPAPESHAQREQRDPEYKRMRDEATKQYASQELDVRQMTGEEWRRRQIAAHGVTDALREEYFRTQQRSAEHENEPPPEPQA